MHSYVTWLIHTWHESSIWCMKIHLSRDSFILGMCLCSCVTRLCCDVTIWFVWKKKSLLFIWNISGLRVTWIGGVFWGGKILVLSVYMWCILVVCAMGIFRIYMCVMYIYTCRTYITCVHEKYTYTKYACILLYIYICNICAYII